MRREGGQQIVDPAIHGGKETGGDPAVGAVGRDEDRDGVQAGNHQDDEDRQQPVAQPLDFFLISKAVFLSLAAAAQPGDDVLEDAQRADDRAVDSAEEQGQDDQQDDHADVQGKDRGQQLDLGHPAEPKVHGACKVEEKQGD